MYNSFQNRNCNMAENAAFSKDCAPEHTYPPSTIHPQVNVYPPSYQQTPPGYQAPQPAPVVQPAPASVFGTTSYCSCTGYPQQNGGAPMCNQHTIIQPNDWKARIPIMPMWLAVTCLVINCILPGFGTVMASCSVCCCSSPAVLVGHGKCRTHCSTFWIGWLQMICIPLFLLGYVWAIAWSIASVQLSKNYYGKDLSSIIVKEDCNCECGNRR